MFPAVIPTATKNANSRIPCTDGGIELKDVLKLVILPCAPQVLLRLLCVGRCHYPTFWIVVIVITIQCSKKEFQPYQDTEWI